MKKILARLYAVYAVVGFFGFFLLLFPFFLLILHDKKKHPFAFYLNKIWALFAFNWAFLPIKIIHKSKVPSGAVIFVANHTSFLDIPLIGVAVDRYVVFLGKASLTKIPIFGYMFKKLHISVERESLRGSLLSIDQAIETLKMGRSLVIFPEATMKNPNPPALGRFKDGAFKIAIETGVPIVPLSLLDNWKILFAYTAQMYRMPARIVFHPPISTQNLRMEDLEGLKKEVFQTIESELLVKQTQEL
jgi:1-acyl-sn-glycerol-3-phosphate acyltransferase